MKRVNKPEQKKLLNQLTEARRSKNDLERETRQLRAKIRSLEDQIKQGIRVRPLGRHTQLLKEIGILHKDFSAKLHALEQTIEAITRLRDRLRVEESPAGKPQTSLSDRYPVLLFPVRLETRFMPADEAPKDLYVRIYPDQVSIDSHDEELSAEEVKAGGLYRKRLQEADLEKNKKDAWRELARQVGPSRAAWIIKRIPEYENRNSSELNPSSSPEAPCVRIMPDYFIVRLYQGDKCVAEQAGKLIKSDPLPVLWNPANALESETEELFDQGSNWIMDFDAACDEGMAVIVSLNRIDYQKGFDRVIAIGVKASVDPIRGTEYVKDLIDAHHYTDGVEFLRHGTPTNNTQTTKSGYSRTRHDIEGQYDIECFPQDLDAPGYISDLWDRDDSYAGRMERALGIATPGPLDDGDQHHPQSDCPVFRHIALANDFYSSFSRQLQEALWPATWGYYFDKLLITNPKNTIKTDVLRDHYRDFVRASGPLPSIRVGNLPYGILPVTKIRNWEPSPADCWDASGAEDWIQTAERMHKVLMKLWGTFLVMSADPIKVPKIGDSTDPDRELLCILAMEPGAVSCGLRNVVMDDFVHALNWFAAQTFYGPGSLYDGLEKTPYERVGDWLGLWLTEVERNAALLHGITGLPVRKDYPRINPKILQLFLWGGASSIKKPFVKKEDNEIDPASMLGEFIKFSVTREPEIKKILDVFKTFPVEILEELFCNCLDLSTHRLDAWITSLATRRLEAMRLHNDGAYRHGIYIGAYGWLEDLRPKFSGGLRETREATPGEILTEGETIASPESTVLSERPDPAQIERPEAQPSNVQGGFIHAPSLGQAAAAAVTRSAYIVGTNSEEYEASKVNLSSERVRRALRIIDGVRQGQTLGVMLGIQFERALHDHSLDSYIDEFRRAFPLKAGKETELQDGESAETVAARNVVDGKELAESWREITDQSESPALETLPEELRELTGLDNEELKRHLGRLVETLDAVSDLWFAEAIYQGTQGRYERMGAALDAAAGAGPIPEVECVRTPRGGRSDTHRVCVLFKSGFLNIDDPNNSRYAVKSRAQAEPLLNKWAKKVLGDDLSKIQCRVSVPSELDIIFNVKKLGISALDFVYMSSTPPSGEEGELEQLIRYKVRKENEIGAEKAVIIDFDRAALDEQNGQKSMGEAIEVARSLLHLIGNATCLHPSMLCLPEEGGTIEFDDGDYAALKNRVVRSLAGLHEVIGQELTGDLAGDAVIIGKLNLNKARKFGLPNTVPAYPPHDNSPEAREDRKGRKQSAYQELLKRKKKAEALYQKAEDAQADDRQNNAVGILVEAMKAIFGSGFTVLPAFSTPRSEELQNALDSNTPGRGNEHLHILGGHGEERIWLWLQQAAQTHPALSRFETALMMQQAWADVSFAADVDCDQDAQDRELPSKPSFQIAQLPFREVDRWVALAKDEWDADPEHLAALEIREQGCLSLAIQAPLSPDLSVRVNGDSQRIAGILIDQWEERIPNKEEITGVSFHYDQPNAQAPNALLLAVPGKWKSKESHWSYADLFETVYDTMDLYRTRLVDLDALRNVGQFLPALYLPKVTATVAREGPVKVEEHLKFRGEFDV